MESIIKLLYSYLPQPERPSDPELEKKRAEYLKMSACISDQYGLEFLDRFTDLYTQVNDRTMEQTFSDGFLYGACLMMELLEV